MLQMKLLQIHASVHISLRLLHRALSQEGIGKVELFELSLKCLIQFQFEYQQAQLEAEIENLSWKVEHAETTDRGDLENQ